MQQYSDVRLNELLSYVAPTQEPICPSCSQDLLAHIRASQSGELLNINEAAVSAKALSMSACIAAACRSPRRARDKREMAIHAACTTTLLRAEWRFQTLDSSS